MKLIKSSFFVFAFAVSTLNLASAAPTQPPAAGGVIQVDPNAPQPSLTIGNTGSLNFNLDTLEITRNNLGAASSGPNSDITSIIPSASGSPVDLSLGNITKNVILNGNVGIGTTSPGAKLSVFGSTQVFGNGGYALDWGNTSTLGRLTYVGTTPYITTANNSTDLIFAYGTSITPVMTLKAASGNVGIGTTGPRQNLEVIGTLKVSQVAGSSQTGITLGREASERPKIEFNVSDNSRRFWFGVNDVNLATERLSLYAGPRGNSAINEAVVFSGDGNVGIGTTSPGAKLDVAGTTLTDRESVAYYRNVIHKAGASSNSGTLKITLPKSWSSTMMKAKIEGFNYTGGARGTSWSVVVGGYNYEPDAAWYNYFAEIHGAAPFNTVRLAHDGTRNVILLGTTSSSWSYPRVAVTEFMAGHSNRTGWDTGWSIDWITSETGIQKVATPNIDMFRNIAGNVGIGTASPSRKLEVAGDVKIGVDNTADSGVLEIARGAKNAFVDANHNSLIYSSSSAFEGWSIDSELGHLIIQPRTSANRKIVFAGSSDGVNTEAKMVIQGDGNVGIGTTNPGAKLDVATMIGSVRVGVSGQPAASFHPGNGTAYFHMYNAQDNTLRFSHGSTVTANPAFMVFKNTGTSANVGIGTTTPDAKLEVAGQIKITGGTPGAGKVLTSDAAGLASWATPSASGITSLGGLTGSTQTFVNDTNVTISSSGTAHTLGWTGALSLARGGTGATTSAGARTNIGAAASGANSDITSISPSGHLVLTPTGNVGVGTTSPSYKLDVVGDVRWSGTLQGGNISASSITSGELSEARVRKVESADTRSTNPNPDTYTSSLQTDFKQNTSDGLSDGGSYHGVISYRPYGSLGDFSGGPMHQLGFTGNSNLWLRTSTGSATWGSWNQIARNAMTNNFSFMGNVGIGTTTPGAKLEVAGQIKITGGIPGAGKVLTSDAAGLASWATPSASGITSLGGLTGSTQTFVNDTNVTISSSGTAHTLGWTGALSLARGGTGATTSAGARTNIGAAASGANSDITSISPSGHLVLTPTGNVGVGTTNPTTAKLVVAGDIDLSADAGGNGILYIGKSGARTGLAFNRTYPNYGIFYTEGASDSVSISPNGGGDTTPVAYFGGGGNVGIGGTTVPGSKLTLRDTEGLSGSPKDIFTIENASATGAPVQFAVQHELGSIRLGNKRPDKLHLITNNSTRLTIDSTGNVGIGTTSPKTLLDVGGGSRTDSARIVFSPGTSTNSAGIFNGMNHHDTILGSYQDGSLSHGFISTGYTTGARTFSIGRANSSTFSTATYQPLFTVVSDTGNVGIGTTSPEDNLHIVSNSKYGFVLQRNSFTDNDPNLIRFSNSGTAGVYSSYIGSIRAAGQFGKGNLVFGTNNGSPTTDATSERMRITYDGNVGIGVTDPDAKLEVAGQIKITGGTPGAGKVLTSDAAGLASWATPSASSQWTASGTNIYNSNTGNVGIGTTDPTSAKLEVVGVSISGDVAAATSGSLAYGVRYSGENIINTFGSMYSSGATTLGYAVKPKSGASGFVSSAGNSNFAKGALQLTDELVFSNASATTTPIGSDITMIERFKVDQAGNVGIGTPSPTAKLDVVGSALIGQKSNSSTNARLDITSGGSNNDATIDFGYYNTFDANIWNVGRNGSDGSFRISDFSSGSEANRLLITTAGDVGIGITPTPHKLAVAGDTWISGGELRLTDDGANDGTGLLQISADDSSPWLMYLANNGTTEGTKFWQNYITDGGDLRWRSGADKNIYFTSSGGLQIDGNLVLPATTATAGIIKSGSNNLLHTYGTENFFAGVGAGNLALTSSNNTGVGYQSLALLTSGTGNSAFGRKALNSTTTGSINSAFGQNALFSNTTGLYNSAFGNSALYWNTGGQYNSAFGYRALLANNTGTWNSAFGVSALQSNTGGVSNNAIGYFALGRNTTGSGNIGIGGLAGYGSTVETSNITGSYNIFIGDSAHPAASNLTNAIAIGKNAEVGASNTMVLGGTGADAVNVGIGVASPTAKLDVAGNVKAAGLTITSMASCTLKTYPWGEIYCGVDETGGGGGGGIGGGGTSGYIPKWTGGTTLGNSLIQDNGGLVSVSGPLSAGAITAAGGSGTGVTGTSTGGSGVFGSSTTQNGVTGSATGSGTGVYGYSASGYGVYCDAANCGGTVAWSPASDIRLKKDVKTIENALDKALSLRGVTYKWKDPKMGESDNIGFIAQEVLKVVPEVITNGPDGYYHIKDSTLTGLLVEAIKEQQKQIESLEARLEKLER